MTRPRGGADRFVKSRQTARRCAVTLSRRQVGEVFPADAKTSALDGAGRVVVVVEAAGGGWNAVPFAVDARGLLFELGAVRSLR